jgi:putative membrane protein
MRESIMLGDNMLKSGQKWRQSVSWMMGALLFGIGEIWAQTATSPVRATAPTRDLGAQVLSTVLFGLLGIVLAIVGFKLFDIVVKFDLEREICEKQNLAVAILCGFMVLGICLIIAATLLS